MPIAIAAEMPRETAGRVHHAPNKRFAFRRRGYIGGALVAAGFFVTLCSQPLFPEGSWSDLILDSLAWFSFLAGLVFRLWPTLYIGGHKRVMLEDRGPYSICRNPLYLGSLFLALSAALFLQSMTFGLCLVAAALMYVYGTIPAEEIDLRQVLGQPYLDYCARVPRLWPKFSLFRTPAAVEVNIKGLRREAKRAALWIFLPLLGELVAQVRAESWWPHWFHLY